MKELVGGAVRHIVKQAIIIGLSRLFSTILVAMAYNRGGSHDGGKLPNAAC